MIDVIYFAWVRERIGLPRERVETEAATVAALVAELVAREHAMRRPLPILGHCGSRWTKSFLPLMRPWPECARWRFFRP